MTLGLRGSTAIVGSTCCRSAVSFEAVMSTFAPIVATALAGKIDIEATINTKTNVISIRMFFRNIGYH